MYVLALGPVEVRANEQQVNLGGPKAKALLAALVQQPRQVVSTERLIRLIWDESPPQSATALVHTYVSLLRRGLAVIGRQADLCTRAPGYLLNLTPDDSDIETFARRLGQAGQYERERRPREAADRYQQALDLWRGPAFDGVDAEFARTRAAGLDDERLAAEEGLARCLLETGRAVEVASRLAKVIEENPLREEARGLLMRALADTGRQNDALATYQDCRRHLLDELGIEPGDKLRELQVRILNGTLTAAGATPPPRPVRSGAVAIREKTPPRNADRVALQYLPPDIPDFTGRAEHLERLLTFAATERVDERTTPTLVISGVGGAGKSALAVHAAHLLRAAYPDGQLFADLRGSERDLESHVVLARFLSALGVKGADLPEDFDSRVELYRRKVQGLRLVIVLDNARSEQQIRGLLPWNPQCLVLVTSRSRLTGLGGAEPIELDFLTVETAVKMLEAIIGADRVGAEPEAAQTIAILCGGIPLAIRAASAKLLARPHWPLRSLAGRLSDEHRRLDELTAGDLAIRSSLQLNYTELDERHRRCFHLLTLLDLPDFGAWVAGPLLDVSTEDAEDAVERLVDLRLLEVVGVDALGRIRYRFHDLVQLFGAEQSELNEPATVVSSALTRMLTAWVTLVEIGASRLPRVTLGLRPPVVVDAGLDPRLAEHTEQNPMEWLKAETPAVVRTVERAHELGIDELTTMLITSLLCSPFAARNEFDGWQRTHEVALDAARRSGAATAEAIVLAGLGQLFYEKDDFARSVAYFQEARQQASVVGDDATQSVALVGIGTIRRDLGQFDEATETLRQACELAEKIGNRQVHAAATYGLGAIESDRGDLELAEKSFTRSVELYQELGDKRGEALAVRGLSLRRRASGEYEPAAGLSARAEGLLREVGDELGATYAAQSVAKTSIRQGRTVGVTESLDACLEVCERYRDRFGIALVTRTIGELALASGDVAQARDLLTAALAMWTELGLPLWQARTLRDLAAAESTLAPEIALTHWRSAADLFATAGSRELAELANLDALTWYNAVRAAHL